MLPERSGGSVGVDDTAGPYHRASRPRRRVECASAMNAASPRMHQVEYLRATAVLLVIAGHLDLIAGGFVGVDIFFVISGFVITKALLESDAASVTGFLRQFYYRRIIRLVPPLAVVTAGTLLVGWWLYLDADLRRLQRAVAWQGGLQQNLLFAEGNPDYFQGLPSAQVLLHTWSLAVEEQFYLIYPLLLAGLWKGRALRGASGVWLFLVVTGAATLPALSNASPLVPLARQVAAWGGLNAPDEALRFYLGPFRAWELLVGASSFMLAAQAAPLWARVGWLQRSRHVWFTAGALGLAVIATATLDATTWPNAQTVMVCLLTAVCLLAADPARRRGDGVVPRTGEYLGGVSYAAYLWHWPVLGVFTYANPDFGAAPGDYLRYGAVLAVFVMPTHHLVERRRFAISPAMSLVVLAAFVAGSLAITRLVRDGSTLPADVQTIMTSATQLPRPCERRLEAISGPFVVLFGDSHAQSLRETFGRAARDRGLQVLCLSRTWTGVGGDPDSIARFLQSVSQSDGYRGTMFAMRWILHASGAPSSGSGARRQRLVDEVAPDEARDAAALSAFTSSLARAVGGLRATQAPIGVLLQVPMMPFVPAKAAIVDYYGLRLRPRPMYATEAHEVRAASTRAALAEAFSGLPGARLFDPAPYLCDESECRHRDGWRMLYRDQDHLSVHGAEQLRPLFDAWFSEGPRAGREGDVRQDRAPREAPAAAAATRGARPGRSPRQSPGRRSQWRRGSCRD